MAHRKRMRTRKGKTRRRFKRAKNRYSKAGLGRGLAAKPHFFKRTVTVPSAWVTSAVSGGAGAAISQTADSWVLTTGTTSNISYFAMSMYFSIDMLPDNSEFLTLFDQYKINRVKLRLTPYSTQSTLQSGVGVSGQNQGLSCIVHNIIDYDDAAALTPSAAGINLIRERLQFKTRNLFASRNGLKQYFSPRVANAAFGGGVFGSYANVKAPWIDSNSPSVQHYGSKWLFEVFQPDVSVSCYIWFKLEATLYLELRQPI